MHTSGSAARSLRTLRERSGLSVTEAAALVDTSERYLEGIESGAIIPSTIFVERLARALALGPTVSPDRADTDADSPSAAPKEYQ
ncbi:helix-turn-helix domain-containing protein [Humidisolicoccus flavus]|uniref:helix-turn-helix domain-containing protein n=1 Tax=Humidisolicoccus flavus TaxID=3111414 RepID=UPI003254305B